MASVPLLCSICPKEPDFSDISHLLTHVASKGHLAHLFKAQVRARQDSTIRRKLDVYDQWYEKYHIARLLSQRMNAKESKDSMRKDNLTGAKPSRSTKTRRKQIKQARTPDEEPSPVKTEDAIDPQLSHSLLPSPLAPAGFLESLRHKSPSSHRAHVPRMSYWQVESPIQRQGSHLSELPGAGKQQFGPEPGTDGESDYFHEFLQSPTRTAYPDPSEVAGALHLAFPAAKDKEPPGKRKSLRTQMQPSYRTFDETPATPDTAQSPILKGVKWPGMSLFDSASLEDQRLRNQKKAESLLEQMEHNSVAVEPMEQIFWPEGQLKKQRLITGNVESSPLSQPSPLPKRRRARAGRAFLADLSVNEPNMRQRRGRKPKAQSKSSKASDSKSFSERIRAYTKSSNLRSDPANALEEAGGRLTRGSPNVGSRGKTFTVFNDIGQDAAKRAKPSHGKQFSDNYLYSETSGNQQGSSQMHKSDHANFGVHSHSSESFSGSNIGVPPKATYWNDSLHPHVRPSRRFTGSEDRENVEPLLDASGHIDDEAHEIASERVTQRYFSMTGDQQPQFFGSMPPQMDFGGLAGPKYHGSTLNPLNPYFRQQPFQSHHQLLPPLQEGSQRRSFVDHTDQVDGIKQNKKKDIRSIQHT